jgi:hypothetical protein
MSPGWIRGALVVGGLGVAACGGGGGTAIDAAVDATPDAAIDAAGTCGTGDAVFAGEVIDWDSTNAKFCGVLDAKVTVRGAAARTDLTNPNGRLGLCLARQPQTVIDVAFSTTPSECTTPKDTYPVPAVLVADQSIVNSNMVLSARAMTGTRQATMFTQVGAPYDAAKGQLVVHAIGTAGAVSITADHATTQAFDGGAWTAGDTGSDVFFPNVAPGATQVSASNMTFTVTVEAGKYTYLTVSSLLIAAPSYTGTR